MVNEERQVKTEMARRANKAAGAAISAMDQRKAANKAAKPKGKVVAAIPGNGG